MPIPPLQSGHLPEGRWLCTPAEVQTAFAPAADAHRQDIWNDWITLAGILRGLVGRIPSAWMSGSFFTDKAVPGDIDCLFLVDVDDAERVRSAGGPDWVLLWTIANSGAKSQLGLNVDSYVLEWAPTPTHEPLSPADYYKGRGYWDDLWVRFRDPNPRLESIPRRGYLEVTLDGYR